MSNASDSNIRHLALVFFDVLYLDSQSLLDYSYSDRRSLLESLLAYRPGYAMLAERTAIDMDDPDIAVEQLEYTFAKLLADHQEGAVLKAEESRYVDYGLRWVKVNSFFMTCSDIFLIFCS
jgi:DNA ligase 4